MYTTFMVTNVRFFVLSKVFNVACGEVHRESTITWAAPHPVPTVGIFTGELNDGDGIDNLVNDRLKPQVFWLDLRATGILRHHY